MTLCHIPHNIRALHAYTYLSSHQAQLVKHETVVAYSYELGYHTTLGLSYMNNCEWIFIADNDVVLEYVIKLSMRNITFNNINPSWEDVNDHRIMHAGSLLTGPFQTWRTGWNEALQESMTCDRFGSAYAIAGYLFHCGFSVICVIKHFVRFVYQWIYEL